MESCKRCKSFVIPRGSNKLLSIYLSSSGRVSEVFGSQLGKSCLGGNVLIIVVGIYFSYFWMYRRAFG